MKRKVKEGKRINLKRKSGKGFFSSQGYKNLVRNLIYGLILLVIGGIAISFYYFGNSAMACSNKDCYVLGLQGCDKVTYIKEDVNSVWRYEVKGKGDTKSSCEVLVTLLEMKEGTAENEILEGLEMECNQMKTQVYPEGDLNKCSGKLKEELQEMIIQKMHRYLIENFETNLLDESA